MGRRRVAQVPRGLVQGRHQVVRVHRKPDGAALVGDGPPDRLLDPLHGVGRELEALAVVEHLDRVHHADVALLDQVQEVQPAPGVPDGDAHHEAEVRVGQLRERPFAEQGDLSELAPQGRGDRPAPRVQCLARQEPRLDGPGQFHLLPAGEQRVPADHLAVVVQGIELGPARGGVLEGRVGGIGDRPRWGLGRRCVRGRVRSRVRSRSRSRVRGRVRAQRSYRQRGQVQTGVRAHLDAEARARRAAGRNVERGRHTGRKRDPFPDDPAQCLDEHGPVRADQQPPQGHQGQGALRTRSRQEFRVQRGRPSGPGIRRHGRAPRSAEQQCGNQPDSMQPPATDNASRPSAAFPPPARSPHGVRAVSLRCRVNEW